MKKFFHISTVKLKKRLTKEERLVFKLDDHLKQNLIRNILGDVHMRRFSDRANARIIFRQGTNNSQYLLHLYDLFQHFVMTPPSIYTVKDKNSTRSNISFSTLALPCFNEFSHLFYFEGTKRVPQNISDYLTKISLAYWIMDDGGFTGNGLKLYTNAFTIEDLNLLVDALNRNFTLKATINKTPIENQYTLYISKNQMPLLNELVIDYIHPSMLYKLNLEAKS